MHVGVNSVLYRFHALLAASLKSASKGVRTIGGPNLVSRGAHTERVVLPGGRGWRGETRRSNGSPVRGVPKAAKGELKRDRKREAKGKERLPNMFPFGRTLRGYWDGVETNANSRRTPHKLEKYSEHADRRIREAPQIFPGDLTSGEFRTPRVYIGCCGLDLDLYGHSDEGGGRDYFGRAKVSTGNMRDKRHIELV